MPLLNGKTSCPRLALLLALASCALQALGGALPSLVVCYRADRAPQVEFFAASCSCHQEARHSGCQHGVPGVPYLEAACTDIPLGSHAIINATAPRHRAPARNPRQSLSSEKAATQAPVIAPRLAVNNGGMPQTTAPPVGARLSSGVPLRC
jgi:hypothetical protein